MVQVEGIPPLVIVNAAEIDSATMEAKRPTVVSEEQKMRLRQQQSQRAIAQQTAGVQQRSSSQSDSERAEQRLDFSKMAEELQRLLTEDRMVQFMIDKATKKIVLRIIDRETQAVIAQLPPEQSLKIAQYILGKVREGLVTDARV